MFRSYHRYQQLYDSLISLNVAVNFFVFLFRRLFCTRFRAWQKLGNCWIINRPCHRTRAWLRACIEPRWNYYAVSISIAVALLSLSLGLLAARHEIQKACHENLFAGVRTLQPNRLLPVADSRAPLQRHRFLSILICHMPINGYATNIHTRRLGRIIKRCATCKHHL